MEKTRHDVLNPIDSFYILRTKWLGSMFLRQNRVILIFSKVKGEQSD
jgi:hypothetical protein